MTRGQRRRPRRSIGRRRTSGTCACTSRGRRQVRGGAAQPEALLRGAPAGRYRIEVIDLLENPQLARDDQILAIPTLVRKLPEPLRKIIGDLSNTERMLVGLRSASAASP